MAELAKVKSPAVALPRTKIDPEHVWLTTFQLPPSQRSKKISRGLALPVSRTCVMVTLKPWIGIVPMLRN